VQDDLAKVPKSQFANVFAQYKGSTGTLLSNAEREEKYVITWTSPKKQIYELPTGVQELLLFFFVVGYFVRLRWHYCTMYNVPPPH
jgi:hypothetical protein